MKSGLPVLNQQQPDLVFIDTFLEDGSAFDLLEHDFHRIHKSHLVNINKMSHLDKADGGFLVMTDGARVPVASRKRDMLMELFEGLE